MLTAPRYNRALGESSTFVSDARDFPRWIPMNRRTLLKSFAAVVAYRLWRRARYGPPDVNRSAVHAATVAACQAQEANRRAA